MSKIKLFWGLFLVFFAIGLSKGYACPEGWVELSFDASYTYEYVGGNSSAISK